MKMTKELVYKSAMLRYGIDNQIIMVFEEMAELQKELSKFKRGSGNTENIAEEIADVQIMLEQMILFFDLNSRVEWYKEEKIERLSKRLAKSGKADA